MCKSYKKSTRGCVSSEEKKKTLVQAGDGIEMIKELDLMEF